MRGGQKKNPEMIGGGFIKMKGKNKEIIIAHPLDAETNDIVRKTLIFFIIFDGVYVKMNDQSTSLSTGNIK